MMMLNSISSNKTTRNPDDILNSLLISWRSKAQCSIFENLYFREQMHHISGNKCIIITSYLLQMHLIYINKCWQYTVLPWWLIHNNTALDHCGIIVSNKQTIGRLMDWWIKSILHIFPLFVISRCPFNMIMKWDIPVHPCNEIY